MLPLAPAYLPVPPVHAFRLLELLTDELLENPWEHLVARYPTGTNVEGRVRNLTDFGAFIEIEDGIDGLVHVSNLSWTKRVKHPSEVLKKGEKVKAVVLGVEPENRRLSLGIKQLWDDPWPSMMTEYPTGRVIDDAAVAAVRAAGTRRPRRTRGAAARYPTGDRFRTRDPRLAAKTRCLGLTAGTWLRPAGIRPVPRPGR